MRDGSGDTSTSETGRRSARLGVALALALAACGDAGAPLDLAGPTADWPAYGGDAGGLKWSPLTQVTADNVGALEVAWTYRHGDVSDGSDGTTRTSFNATPIVAGGTLYLCTGRNRVIALDPETGAEKWTFDPKPRVTKLEGPYPRVCRGVAHWTGDAAQSGACARRIFTGTVDSELIALDAETGRPCDDFGAGGRVSLREGIEGEPWEYYVTSPPLVVGDAVVVGALVSDNLRTDAPAGVVRAFDARSGALRWAWDPVPPGWNRDAGERYTAGTPNVWAAFSADPARGLVFVPTGNAAPDYYGGARRGLDHYSSSVVALDAASGAVRWHYQTVHHDHWDYDVPAQPSLFQIEGVGGGRPGVAQITKMGHLFLLDRESGAPLYPTPERPVPQGGVPGDVLSPTQPFPTHPAPLHPATFTPDDAWGFTFWDKRKCREIIAGMRSDGIFTPPGTDPIIQWPGNAGGPNWGGVAIDPARGVLFVNQMRVPSVVRLVPRDEFDAIPKGDVVYPEMLAPMRGTPFGLRISPLLGPLGAPCNPPPWGVLQAVDLKRGELLWESTLGTTRDQAPFPMWLPLGSPNLGGPVATAGGVVFIGATTDQFLRGFGATTGEELWRARLPFTANATPITYRLREGSRQFVVVAAGGHGWSTPGDALVAFALPQ
ncbi:MAG: pyrroloquinoline quinone-dependent dehydrogenase [Proteobacteria bacterium]|nr:MAG: pyrroloquinoline quinone-dependent dehydrogenase [Pseudomonadota bacterium]